jgi:hypothetical protein
MTVVVVLLVVVLIAVVVLIVSAPLRRRGAQRSEGDDRRDELEAAKEAKYRELRDLELDYRTGKLSDEDYRALDRTLRAEAVEILRRLDELD